MPFDFYELRFACAARVVSVGNKLLSRSFVFLAVLSTIVATGMNNFAVSKLQLSTMAAFGGVSTFTTIFIGAVFEGEKIMTFHIIGFTLIFIRMFGVSAINIIRDKKKAKAAVSAAEQKTIEADSVKL